MYLRITYSSWREQAPGCLKWNGKWKDCQAIVIDLIDSPHAASISAFMDLSSSQFSVLLRSISSSSGPPECSTKYRKNKQSHEHQNDP
jgi:hypothetical protein